MLRNIFLSLLFMLPTVVFAEELPYSAIVMDVTGNVKVLHQGGIKTPDLGDLLYPGDTVETAKNASLTINYPESGEEEQWPGDVKLIVGKAQSESTSSRVTKKNRKIVLPQIESPQQGKYTLRGVKIIRMIEVKGLSNTLTLEQRPTFRWDSISSADKYTVILYSELDDKPLWQGTTTDAEIPYPKTTPPLKFGSSYEWELEALSNEVVIAMKNSVFDLPTKEELTIIREQKGNYEAQLSNHPEDVSTRLAFAFLLEHHRLYDDAIKQYEIIRKVHNESEYIKNREERLLQIRNSNPLY